MEENFKNTVDEYINKNLSQSSLVNESVSEGCVITPSEFETFLRAKQAFNNGNNVSNIFDYKVKKVSKIFEQKQGQIFSYFEVDYDTIMVFEKEDKKLVSSRKMVVTDFETYTKDEVDSKFENDLFWQAFRFYTDGGEYLQRLENFLEGKFPTFMQNDKDKLDANLVKRVIWIKNFVRQDELQKKDEHKSVVEEKDFEYTVTPKIASI